MNLVFYDFETFYSSKDYTLSKMGPLEYIRDERFDPFMVCYAQNNCVTLLGENTHRSDVVRSVLDSIDYENSALIAHNGGGFDHLILSEHFGIRPKHLWDSIWMMRWCGLSGICAESHAALTSMLGNGEKKAGTVVSDNKHWPQDFTPEEQEFFAGYCQDDTKQLRENVRVMLPYLTSDCLRFMSLTARMATEPVFILYTVMLEEYIRQLDEEADNARRAIMELFHFTDLQGFFKALRSAETFAGLLRSLGVEPPTKLSEKKTATAIAKAEAAGDSTRVMELRENGIRTYAFSKSDVAFLALTEHEDARVRLLVETRLEFNSSIMRSRAETFLKFARQGKPLPIMLSAFKAHTSRYTAGTSAGKTDGLQMQNLAKRNPAYKPLRRAIRVPHGMKVVAVDSSQIEARCLAWIAGQQDLVEHFRNRRDPYAEFAVNFAGGMTAQEVHDGAKAEDKKAKHYRDLAKKFILSAGYGVGAVKVSHALWQEGIRLAADFDSHSVIAADYLQVYRYHHAAIVRFWKLCQGVIDALARGESGEFAGLFRYGIMDVVGRFPVPTIMLPSGYGLRYPNLRLTEDGYVYDQHRGKQVVPTRIYGGLLTNNIIQGFSFQVLMWQACRMDEEGIALKGNIHDCWFTVVPEEQAQPVAERMVWHMRQTPAWAQGLPLDAEAKLGETFEVC